MDKKGANLGSDKKKKNRRERQCCWGENQQWGLPASQASYHPDF